MTKVPVPDGLRQAIRKAISIGTLNGIEDRVVMAAHFYMIDQITAHRDLLECAYVAVNVARGGMILSADQIKQFQDAIAKAEGE